LPFLRAAEPFARPLFDISLHKAR